MNNEKPTISFKPHQFAGEDVCFATKHGKEAIVAPLLSTLNLNCFAIEVDTDQFGTFSGEVERVGSIRETLRKKIRAGAHESESRFVLASEGSFGPHPIIGFIPTNLESLLLWDRKHNVEIYSEWLCTKPVHNEKVLSPKDDFRSALSELGFPEHAVMVHPENKTTPIFKGLITETTVAQAMLDSFSASNTGRVVLANDLRAFCNPTRQKAIYQAGTVLIEKLESTCPSCNYPGYATARGEPGLPCAVCDEPSRVAKAVVLECVKCAFTETKPRPDQKTSIDPSECEFCNP